MNKIILVLLSLIVTTSVFAAPVESCSTYALGAPARDGYSAESKKFSAEVEGVTHNEMEITYYFNLKEIRNAGRKIAIVKTNADCMILGITYFNAQ